MTRRFAAVPEAERNRRDGRGWCWLHGVLLAMSFLFAPPAAAHPHAWVDLRSTLIVNADGRITGIEQEWLFDDLYTLFVIEGAQRNGVDQKKAFIHLAETNLRNLRAYNYFTEVRVAGAPVTLDTVTEFESELRGGRLWMRFVAPLPQAVDAAASTLSYAVYDPTYYVEILHLKGDAIAFRGPRSPACHGRIVAPAPSAEDVILARALDKNARPDNTLGRVFAEWVDVSCR